jgi:hypothetical protein
MRIDTFPFFYLPAIVICWMLVAAAAMAGPFDDPGHLPSEMTAWATSVDDFMAGPVDIAQPGLGYADFGLPALVLGPSQTDGGTDPGDVFSLGDGGFITLYFDAGIGDGIGNDFAVFENGFVDQGSGFFFGEFAFVEVSTDGLDFARFPATSLQASPVGAFAVVDPTDYHNLAGDQLIGFGTGFDLGDLWDDPLVQNATLDLTDVRFVRIVDVIGDGSTVDQASEPIYDPYATAFASGGFDAEAVGVLHTAPEPRSVQLLAVGVAALIGAARARERRKNPCAAAP